MINEPNGAADWFPVNDHPRDKATYHFDIRVPQPWVAVAPGTLRESTNDDGHTRYIWDMDTPMASYLASINIDQAIPTVPAATSAAITNCSRGLRLHRVADRVVADGDLDEHGETRDAACSGGGSASAGRLVGVYL